MQHKDSTNYPLITAQFITKELDNKLSESLSHSSTSQGKERNQRELGEVRDGSPLRHFNKHVRHLVKRVISFLRTRPAA